MREGPMIRGGRIPPARLVERPAPPPPSRTPRAVFTVDRQPPRDPARVADAAAAMVAAMLAAEARI